MRMKRAALRTGENDAFQLHGLLWSQTQPEEIRAAQLQQGKKHYFSLPQAFRFIWAFCWASQWVKAANWMCTLPLVKSLLTFSNRRKIAYCFWQMLKMIHHKSSFLFQDHIMHSSATGLWSLACLKSSSFPATYLAVRRVCWNMTQPKRRQCAEILHITVNTTALLDIWKLLTSDSASFFLEYSVIFLGRSSSNTEVPCATVWSGVLLR